MFAHQRPWRWVRVRLWGLLTRDTASSRLYERDQSTPKPTRSTSPGKRPLTPEGVGTLLDAWTQ